MTQYGQTITWTNKDGSVSSVTVRDRPTREMAVKDAIEHATAFGWTYPRWYQWWRKNDTRPDFSVID